MTDVAPARGKRARSPSPVYAADTLASPLEVLLKRRRRSEKATAAGIGSHGNGHYSTHSHGSNNTNSRMFAPPPPPLWTTDDRNGQTEQHNQYDADNSSQAAASSPLRRHDADYDEDDGSLIARRAIERRRTRQWERLQDPSARASSSAPNTAQHPSTMYSQHLHSQQHLPLHYSGQGDNSRSLHSSPAERATRHRPHPQATPERLNAMSSSPVHHNPPSSTPFRDDEWTEDERVREWGDEYAAQNSVLYSLHRARVDAIHASTPATDNPLVTPAQQRIAQGTPHTSPFSLPAAYRHHQRTPLDTPGLVSSEYASSPLVGPFSPSDAPAGPAPSPAQYGGRPTHEADTVRAGYEEANRLLAALNVARLRRHSEHEEMSPLRRPERDVHETMDERW